MDVSIFADSIQLTILTFRRESKVNEEEKLAYEWAKKQNYQSVAAQYARILVT